MRICLEYRLMRNKHACHTCCSLGELATAVGQGIGTDCKQNNGKES